MVNQIEINNDNMMQHIIRLQTKRPSDTIFSKTTTSCFQNGYNTKHKNSVRNQIYEENNAII